MHIIHLLLHTSYTDRQLCYHPPTQNQYVNVVTSALPGLVSLLLNFKTLCWVIKIQDENIASNKYLYKLSEDTKRILSNDADDKPA